MNFLLRKATLHDQTAIERLIAASVRGLSHADYTARQIELSIGTVFGVDTELIQDGTYFVAAAGGKIVGGGGWSRRRALYGASRCASSRDSALLDPQTERPASAPFSSTLTGAGAVSARPSWKRAKRKPAPPVSCAPK